MSHRIKPIIAFLPLLLIFPLSSLAQESLSPLRTNPQVPGHQSVEKSYHNSLFIYLVDTLDIPFEDDFSRNNLKPYDAHPSDTGVEDTVFYRLWDNSQPLSLTDTIGYMLGPTHRFEVDTVNSDTVITDTFQLPSRMVWVNIMNSYPKHDTISFEMWPAYNVFDTLWTGNKDTNFIDDPDYVQDSLQAYIIPPDSTQSLWVDKEAFINNNYPTDPPTIGVATLDGLNDEGYPYNFNNSYAQGEADHLTSKPLDLNYFPGDSLYLSFFHQPAGEGNPPNPEDSLVLEFYSPTNDEWERMWSHKGDSVRDFKLEMIPINQPRFLQEGFQFRFMNYATLSGSFDHWNVDYVRVDNNRAFDDTTHDDVAFTEYPASFLDDFTSIPWKHFENDPAGAMTNSISIEHRNLSNTGKFVENTYSVYHEGNKVFQGNTVLESSVSPHSTYDSDHSVSSSPNNYVFDTSLADTQAIFDVSFIHRVSPDRNELNDSVTSQQKFSAYYSYDDGSAEAAYGVIGQTAKIAMEFNPLMNDTLIALDIYFAPSFQDVSDESFFITVWEGTTHPSNQVYQNFSFSTPEYAAGNNRFVTYPLDDPYPVTEKFYVGLAQTTEARLNIGFDKSVDKSNRIYYNTSGTWANTSFSGSLMIRPVFASDLDYLQSIKEDKPSRMMNLNFYPNPVRDRLHIDHDLENPSLKVEMYDISGRKVLEKENFDQGTLNLSNIQNGMYLLKVMNRKTRSIKTSRILIQH